MSPFKHDERPALIRRAFRTAAPVALLVASLSGTLLVNAPRAAAAECTTDTAKVSLSITYDPTVKANVISGAQATGFSLACNGRELEFLFMGKDGSLLHAHIVTIKDGIGSLISCNSHDPLLAADVYTTRLQLLD